MFTSHRGGLFDGIGGLFKGVGKAVGGVVKGVTGAVKTVTGIAGGAIKGLGIQQISTPFGGFTLSPESIPGAPPGAGGGMTPVQIQASPKIPTNAILIAAAALGGVLLLTRKR